MERVSGPKRHLHHLHQKAFGRAMTNRSELRSLKNSGIEVLQHGALGPPNDRGTNGSFAPSASKRGHNFGDCQI